MTERMHTGATPARAAPASLVEPAAPPWLPGAALGLVLATVFVLALSPLWATDLGWQLRLGRDLLARGVPAGIPRVDTLSWSVPGAPWIELRWLWALGLAVLERVGGYAAISYGAATIVTLAFGLAAATAFRGPAAAWTPAITLAAALASQQRFLARPETFTFAAVAAFLLVLHRHVPGRPKARWLLPALQVLWVNTHTLFGLGPVLVAAWVVAGVIEKRGTLGRDLALLAATLAACLVNPYGARAFAFAFLVWSELHTPLVRAVISELASPFAVAGGFQNLRWFVVLLVAVPAVAVGVLVRRRRIDAFLALATALGAGLALTSVRNLPLFALPAIPFLAHHLGGVLGAGRARRAAAIGAPALAAVLAAVTIVDVTRGAFYTRQNDPRGFGAGITRSRYPTAAATILRQVGVEDRVFATFHESSWLLAEGFRSWLDPRIEVFGPAHLERTLRAQGDSASWARLAHEARPAAVVVGLDQPAFAALLEQAGWGLAGLDEVAAVYLPAGPSAPGLLPKVLADVLVARPPPSLPPAAAERLAGFLLQHDRGDLAGPYLAGRVPRDPGVATEWALDLLSRGKADEAAALLDPILKLRQAPARAWALRGEAYGMNGRLAAAESCLVRAAGLDPANANIRQRLASIRRARGGGTP